MGSHKYILRENDVGQLASSVAMQEGEVNFKKDSQSTFYIATVLGENITVPESIAALKMQDTSPQSKGKNELVKYRPKNMISESEAGTLDESTNLTVRLHFSQAIEPEKLPLIYEEIAKAIDSAIRKMDNT